MVQNWIEKKRKNVAKMGIKMAQIWMQHWI